MQLLLPAILIVLALFVLVVLPTRARNRQVQQLQRMQAGLDIGTEVMTSSGLYGRVVRLGADDADLEIAPGVVTTWALLAIREVKSPTRAPASDLDADQAELEAADLEPADPDAEPEPGAGRRSSAGPD